jgi:hypothetical protein
MVPINRESSLYCEWLPSIGGRCPAHRKAAAANFLDVVFATSVQTLWI